MQDMFYYKAFLRVKRPIKLKVLFSNENSWHNRNIGKVLVQDDSRKTKY